MYSLSYTTELDASKCIVVTGPEPFRIIFFLDFSEIIFADVNKSHPVPTSTASLSEILAHVLMLLQNHCIGRGAQTAHFVGGANGNGVSR